MKANFFLFFALYSSVVLSQQYNFRTYSTRHGLINPVVIEMFQDSKGYIWVGTSGGLNRFDGKKFYEFGSKLGFPGKNIFAIQEDKNGHIWVSDLERGIYKYDGTVFTPQNNVVEGNNVYNIVRSKDEQLYFIGLEKGIRVIEGNQSEGTISSQHFFPSDKAFSFLIDRKGNRWYATQDTGLVKQDKTGFTIYNKSNGLTRNRIFSLLEDSRGRIWIGTAGGGINYFENGKISVVEEVGDINNSIVYDIKEDLNGNIWFATENGLVKYDGSRYKLFNEKNGLSSSYSFSLLIDYSGNLWVGTLNGINLLTNEAFITFNDRNGLHDNHISAVYKHSDGWIVAGNNVGGIDIIDEKNNYIKNILKDEINTTILSFTEDAQHQLWIGTQSGDVFVLKLSNGHASIVKQYPGNKFKDLGIPYIMCNGSDVLVATYGAGLYRITDNEPKSFIEKGEFLPEIINCIFKDYQGDIWLGTADSGIYKYTEKGFESVQVNKKTLGSSILAISQDRYGNMLFATDGDGLKIYDGGSFHTYTSDDGLCSDVISSVAIDSSNNIWIGTPKGVNKIKLSPNLDITGLKFFGEIDGLKGNIENNPFSIYSDHATGLWMATNEGLVNYNPRHDHSKPTPPRLILNDIKLHFEKVDWNKFSDNIDKTTGLPIELELGHKNNHLTFYFQALTVSDVYYTYMLEGFDEGWTPLTKDNFAIYSNIPPGNYTFRIKAKNSEGIWSNEKAEFHFSIIPPVYKRPWFIILSVIFVIILVLGFIKLRTAQLTKDKKRLESKVASRTQDLKEANEKLSHAYKGITDSINYAKKIQDAILPLSEDVSKALPESFILYKPRDIVSGDFYWLNKKEGKTFIAAVDCTGHGVPGAFMSMIGNSLLNDIVNDKSVTDPAVILQMLHDGIRRSLNQDRDEFSAKDGMDIALCVISNEGKLLEFSGAKRPLYLFRNKNSRNMEEIKGDKLSIGGSEFGKKHEFTNNKIELNAGDTIYMFSDGYADQFGGDTGKKLSTKAFKKILSEIVDLPMHEQKIKLSDAFDGWSNNYEQLDDVLVIGIRPS